ncbi:chitosanase [Streptomyces sp. R-07]|uniref:chitosanase n=1 Tax=Streptomyces sp. R-07 TaxID=3404052 RepID=UPI003CF9BAA2
MRRNTLLWQAIAATALAGGLAAGFIGLTPASAAGTNLALGKPVTASSVEGVGLEPAKAVDGSTSTRWASAEGVDNQWIRIDLGSVTDVGQVVLKWEAAYAKSYRVELSDDGSTWRQVYSTTTGDGATDDFAVSGSGRYLRVYGTQRGTAYGYSLYEIGVYGGSTTTPSPTTPPPSATAPLDDPYKKEIAMKLVSSFENSSLDWHAQFAYIEDIDDGRGYTAGIIGFCSGTGDMLDLVERYTQKKPGNPLAPYLPALREVNGTDSHDGLGTSFENAWRTAAQDAVFRQTQEEERDRVYFNPAVGQAKTDGLKTLGQFAYYDAAVMHGEDGFRAIRSRAVSRAKPPSQGGNEVTFLNAFLDEREAEMRKEEAHSDTTRVSTAQRRFLNEGNLYLNTPLYWSVYGESFSITA